MDLGWYIKCQCWKVPPGRLDLAHGGSGSPLKSPAMGLLTQLLPWKGGSRGGFTPSRVLEGSSPWVPAWGCVTASRAPQEATLVPPGQCAAGTSLPARARTAVSCVPPQQPGFSQPCFPSRFVPSYPCSSAEIPGAGFVAAAFAAQCEVPAPQTHCSRGNARSRMGQVPLPETHPSARVSGCGRDPSSAHGTWAMGLCQGELLLSHRGLEHP